MIGQMKRLTRNGSDQSKKLNAIRQHRYRAEATKMEGLSPVHIDQNQDNKDPPDPESSFS
jgi:hypothetical protein